MARRGTLTITPVAQGEAAAGRLWRVRSACSRSRMEVTMAEAFATLPGGTTCSVSGTGLGAFPATYEMTGFLRWGYLARWPALFPTARCCLAFKRDTIPKLHIRSPPVRQSPTPPLIGIFEAFGLRGEVILGGISRSSLKFLKFASKHYK